MRVIKIVIKCVILFMIATMYNMITQSISPIIANELAMNQMQNTIDSSFGIQAYTYLSNHDWFVFLILVVAMFLDDIVKFYENIKEKKNNEEI